MVGDTERTLKSGEASGISVLTRGGTTTRIGGYAEDEPRRRWLLLLSIGIAVFVVAGGGLFFFLTTRTAITRPAITAPKSAIPATQHEIISLAETDRSLFLTQWNALYKKPLLPTEFRAVSVFNTITQTFFTTRELFSLLQIAPPPPLLAGFRDTPTLGTLRTARGIETILIITIRSFSETLAGMLEWERNLPQALNAMLAPDISLERGSTGFEDIVIANHDVRLLKNTAGESVLAYTIFNRQTLIIVQSTEALETILRQFSFFPPS